MQRTRIGRLVVTYRDDGLEFIDNARLRRSWCSLRRQGLVDLAKGITEYLSDHRPATAWLERGGSEVIFSRGMKLRVAGEGPTGTRYLGPVPLEQLPEVLTVIAEYLAKSRP